tara:strand:- start:14332 stop:14826 length:495 start_codon:yes stop_codon:yes gene_type:complete
VSYFSFIPNRFSHQVSVAVLTCIVSLNVFAQTSAEKEAAIAGAMGAMDEFMLAFNARDPEAWAASLNYPQVRLAGGTVTIWDSAEEYAQYAQTRALVTIPKTGWDHSHWLTRDVVLVSAEKVHIATVFQRYNSDNEILATYETLYIVTKVDGHWGTQIRSSLAP